jgi:hypothetical protein
LGRVLNKKYVALAGLLTNRHLLLEETIILYSSEVLRNNERSLDSLNTLQQSRLLAGALIITTFSLQEVEQLIDA